MDFVCVAPDLYLLLAKFGSGCLVISWGLFVILKILNKKQIIQINFPPTFIDGIKKIVNILKVIVYRVVPQ